MTTIRETDTEITQVGFGARHGRSVRYIVSGYGKVQRCADLAEAKQARADITDEQAGSARKGDIVRIGAGAATYRVDGFDDTQRAVLYPTAVLTPAQSRVRRVECERLHVVKAER